MGNGVLCEVYDQQGYSGAYPYTWSLTEDVRIGKKASLPRNISLISERSGSQENERRIYFFMCPKCFSWASFQGHSIYHWRQTTSNDTRAPPRAQYVELCLDVEGDIASIELEESFTGIKVFGGLFTFTKILTCPLVPRTIDAQPFEMRLVEVWPAVKGEDSHDHVDRWYAVLLCAIYTNGRFSTQSSWASSQYIADTRCIVLWNRSSTNLPYGRYGVVWVFL